MPTRRLYALLVAVNNYQPPVPPLKGCIPDLKKMAAYVQGQSGEFEIHLHQLTDKDATRDNVVKAFTDFFAPAGSNDVVLFYFSGHGTQEEADPIFWSVEEDRALESIVCYDSYTISQGTAVFKLLSDKELRYLIHKVSQNNAHIVTIFDCCHSGGNTRNALESKEGEDLRERRIVCEERLSQAFPARLWKDFIFSGSVNEADVKKEGILKHLPEGKHIQMAACQNDESAFEVGGEGIFTKNLLDVLSRSGGAVTYFDLQARIQNYVKYEFKQMPKTYVVGDDESSLFVGFLNKTGEFKPFYGNVNFNQTKGWLLDLGSMHGLSAASLVEVHALQGREVYHAKIESLSASEAEITFDPADAKHLDKSASYKAYTTDYLSAPISINLNIDEPSIRDEFVKVLSTSADTKVNVTSAESGADILIKYKDQHLFLSRPQMPTVPIVQPLEFQQDLSSQIIKNYVQHIAQYAFVKNMSNPNSFLFSDATVEVSIYQKNANQQEEPIPIKNGDVFPPLNQSSNGTGGSVRIKLKNKSDRKLYCALLYLSFNFGVTVKLLKEVVVGLEPNAEVCALDGAEIKLVLEDEIKHYNYSESTTTLKLMVSTSDFKQQAIRFEMLPLPAPLESAKRGLEVSRNENGGQLEDWFTRNIRIRIKNPYYQIPP